MHLKISSAKRRPFCPGGDELILLSAHNSSPHTWWIPLRPLSPLLALCAVIWLPMEVICGCKGQQYKALAGIILYMHPANERRRYNVTSSLIGWMHILNDPCFGISLLQWFWYKFWIWVVGHKMGQQQFFFLIREFCMFISIENNSYVPFQIILNIWNNFK